MTPDLLLRIGIRPALSLLPPAMSSAEAEAFLLAIAIQESDGLRARRQYLGGPARSFWQAEEGGGFKGVLTHPATAAHARALCRTLVVPPTYTAVYVAIEFHDVLAAGFARLLLWTLPSRLPRRHEPDEAWRQYADKDTGAWRPGKPHPSKWPASWAQAWQAIDAAREAA